MLTDLGSLLAWRSGAEPTERTFALRWWVGGRVRMLRERERERDIMPYQNMFNDNGSVEYVAC